MPNSPYSQGPPDFDPRYPRFARSDRRRRGRGQVVEPHQHIAHGLALAVYGALQAYKQGHQE